jgi:putative transposase
MPSSNSHRKRVRHYDLPGHCHELTFSCYDRRPLLNKDRWREQLARSIDNANKRHGWRLTAFVFMPEHVHLLLYPMETASKVSELLFAIKRPFSYRVKQALQAERSPLLEHLTIRQRPNVTTFRFWQEGPGFDRNLTTEKAILAAINYLHLNPVRRKLCQRADEWRWSSARWYASDGRDVDPHIPQLTPLPAGFFHVGTRGAL